MLEIFPKLSGLDGLRVTNLSKKEGNKWNELNNPDDIIKSHIKQKDVVYFDLFFSDVWVDVLMTTKDTHENTAKKFKISFEMKTEISRNDKDFEAILINFGIKNWISFNSYSGDEDYYLVNRLKIDSEIKHVKRKTSDYLKEDINQKDFEEDKELNLLNTNDDEEGFDIGDKIECTLTFTNFTNYIVNEAINEVERNNKSFNKEDEKVEDVKKAELKEYFNKHFQDLYVKNSEKVIEDNKILCKISPQYSRTEDDDIYGNCCSFFYENPPIKDNQEFTQRKIGPQIIYERKSVEKKNIEMQNMLEIKKDNDRTSINSGIYLSFEEQHQTGKELENKNSHDGGRDGEETLYTEYINKINYDAIIDKFNLCVLDKKFSENDINKKMRNYNFIEGDIPKNKANSEKDIDKKSSNDIKPNTFAIEEDSFYNSRLNKKYLLLIIAIILLIIIAIQKKK
jgi:hypothetical protein